MNETNTRPIAMQIGLPAGHLVTQPPGHPAQPCSSQWRAFTVERTHHEGSCAHRRQGIRNPGPATPEIQPNEVLINTAYAGVCGTDHDLYAGRPGSAAAVPPIVLGHENSGVVAAIGSEVTGVKVGDRVAVDPNIYCGQCEYCLTQRPELCDHLSAVGVTRDGVLPNSSPRRPP